MIDRLGWHIIKFDKKLKYDDNRTVRVGEKLGYKSYGSKPDKYDPVEICRRGMHASADINDAYYFTSNFAIDGWLCRVIIHNTNYEARNHTMDRDGKTGKFVGTHRTVLGMIPMATAWQLSEGRRYADGRDFDTKAIIALMQKRNKKNGNKTKVR